MTVSQLVMCQIVIYYLLSYVTVLMYISIAKE